MDDFSTLFSDFSLSDFLPSSDTFSSLLDVAAPILTSALQPTANPLPPYYPSAPMGEEVAIRGRGLPALPGGVPRWAQQFPNLWQYLRQKFPFMSPGRALSGLLSLFRKYGPTALVGMLGSAVVGELLTYSVTKKRRRMNVANTKALRRGLRRLKGFEHLSHRVSAQLSRTAGRGRSRSRSRCGTCRRSPCTC